jgi:hypothetical protein
MFGLNRGRGNHCGNGNWRGIGGRGRGVPHAANDNGNGRGRGINQTAAFDGARGRGRGGREYIPFETLTSALGWVRRGLLKTSFLTCAFSLVVFFDAVVTQSN